MVKLRMDHMVVKSISTSVTSQLIMMIVWRKFMIILQDGCIGIIKPLEEVCNLWCF